MKKFLLLVLFALTMSYTPAQDVTKFLGIPVDGPKSEMIKKLQEKGFKYDQVNDALTGAFNGEEVVIQIQTNGSGDVWRVALMDKTERGEIDIRIRFNRLLSQFENNDKYEKIEALPIPEGENMSYEMTVKKKRYQASFCQKSSGKPNQNNGVWFMINEKYGDYRILMFYENEKNNPSNGADL